MTSAGRVPATLGTTLTKLSSGLPAADLVVSLETKPRGSSTWQVSAVTSDAEGGVSAVVDRAAPATYRFGFAGSLSFDAGRSGELFLAGATRTAAAWKPTGHRVTGRLLQADGVPVVGATMVLQRRYVDATRWATVDRVVSGSSGRVAVERHVSRGADYRWVYRATGTWLGSRSTAVRVRP